MDCTPASLLSPRWLSGARRRVVGVEEREKERQRTGWAKAPGTQKGTLECGWGVRGQAAHKVPLGSGKELSPPEWEVTQSQMWGWAWEWRNLLAHVPTCIHTHTHTHTHTHIHTQVFSPVRSLTTLTRSQAICPINSRCIGAPRAPQG